MSVTRLQFERRLVEGGRVFGAGGSYEELRGTAEIALDPRHPCNQVITDLMLAPRDPDARVHFTCDVIILRPADTSRSNRCLLLDVVNRGQPIALRMLGTDWLLQRGFTVAMCGWQHDLPPAPGMIRGHLPEAMDGDQPISGLVRSVQQPNQSARVLPLGDVAGAVAHVGYPPSVLTDSSARLIEREYPWGPSRDVPRQSWHFTADGTGVDYADGFTPGNVYEVIYTASGAPITGAGLAAARDVVSFLRFASAADGNPCGGDIDRALAFGASQTGRFLRQFLYLGLCEDENNRLVLDGVLAHIAGARQLEANWRFGQSSYNGPDSMSSLFPFSDAVQTDAETDQTRGLLSRAQSRDKVPKVMHVNSSAEYWGPQNAALIHIMPDGSADATIPDSVRIYHLAGCDHFANSLPLTNTVAPLGNARAPYYLNAIDYTPLLRAAFANLEQWVADGTPPPPSRYPRLDDRTLVPCEMVRAAFSDLPGPGVPLHRNPLRRLDFGPFSDQGIVSQLPPAEGPMYPELAPAVDADGNELSGVRHPDVSVPLATYTGWQPRPVEIGGADMPLPATGATIPFARSRSEREVAHDRRPSIAERYPSRDAFLHAVRAAARALVRDRSLLAEDVDQLVDNSGRRYDAWMTLPPGALPAITTTGGPTR